MCMFCDDVANLDASERSRYADLLVLIAAADGELVREEIQVLEGLMGRALLPGLPRKEHPSTTGLAGGQGPRGRR